MRECANARCRNKSAGAYCQPVCRQAARRVRQRAQKRLAPKCQHCGYRGRLLFDDYGVIPLDGAYAGQGCFHSLECVARWHIARAAYDPWTSPEVRRLIAVFTCNDSLA